jgi:hypothetical protein
VPINELTKSFSPTLSIETMSQPAPRDPQVAVAASKLCTVVVTK